MKKIIQIQALILCALALFSFNNPLKDESFTVDTERSSVEWAASKVTGKHNGDVKLSSGLLVFNGKSIKSGKFDVDMSTIVCKDLEGEMNQKLVGHLKSDDFFSVEKNPTSTFVITKVAPAGTDRVNITGDLTIKGIKQAVTFPATVKRQNDAVVAVAKGIKIDRTKYDIKYRSTNFFENLGDKAINDEFELSINLVAKK